MARTSNTIQQAEIEAYQAFATEHGIELEGQDGQDNGKVVVEFVAEQMDSMISKTSLEAALPYLKDKLIFKTAEQKALETVIRSISVSERQLFMDWFKRQTHIVNDNDSDQALENACNILIWATQRGGATEKNFDLALGNLPGKGIKIHYKPKKSTFEGGRHSGKQFDYSDRTNRAHADTHASSEAYEDDDGPIRGIKPSQQQEAATEGLSESEALWKQEAEKIAVGHTHSQTAELAAVTGRSWREIYSKRMEIIRRAEKVRG